MHEAGVVFAASGPCAVSSDRCECEYWGGTEAACAAPVSGVSA